MAKTFTLAEIAKHNTESDCWLVIHGKVYDVTKFLDQHPGGEEVLIDSAGREGSADFDDVGHSDEAIVQMKDYLIGEVEGGATTSSKKAAAANKGSAPAGSSDSTSMLTFAVFGVIAAAAAYFFFFK